MDMEQAVLAQLNDAQSPPPAANPSPGAGGPPPSHPSYVEMITAAIQWGSSQGKEGGSSKRAIAKYIDRVYTNLPASHSALLTHHLKRLKNSGQLVMVKNSYQLSSSLSPPSLPPTRSAPVAAPVVPDFPAPVGSTPKRGPGRPPKLKPAVHMSMPMPISSDPVVDNGSGSETAKKRRGRPSKRLQEGAVATEVPFVQPISEVRPNVVNGEVTLGHKRRPGRPPKLVTPPVVPFAAAASEPVVEVNVEEGVTPKRRPGRPPKVKASSVVVGSGPERPAEGSVSVRPRGRPRKNVMGPVVSRPVGKRPRGRPRKMGGGAVSGGGALGLGVGMGMGMRRGRGRPPKGGGPLMVRRRPGRPVGRPRKDASILRHHTADQEVVNEELLRKFELIQSKIREAVIVIRPCVADESPALTALQQLEELATMDLTAPPKAPPSPPETMTIPQSTSGGPPTPAVPVSIAPASTGSPTANVSAPFMGAPFTVTVPPMNVSAPFHAAPSGMETQHSMSWFSSNEGQS